MLSCEKVARHKATRMTEKAPQTELKSFLEKASAPGEDLDEDTRCGYGFLRGKLMQKLASKKTFLIVHSLTGIIYNASFDYYMGTLTTLEKHYKFSSSQVAYFGSAYDAVGTVAALIAPFYCSKGRIPKWMGFAMFCFGFSFMIFILPFVFYGAGSDALALTEEFGESFNPNSTHELAHQIKMKELCYANSETRLTKARTFKSSAILCFQNRQPARKKKERENKRWLHFSSSSATGCPVGVHRSITL